MTNSLIRLRAKSGKPTFHIDKNAATRRSQIQARLKSEQLTLAGVVREIPNKKIYQDLILDGRELMRDGARIAKQLAAVDLRVLRGLASQTDTFKTRVTRYMQKVERDTEAVVVADGVSRKKLIAALLIASAVVVTVMLARKRRQRLDQIDKLINRIESTQTELNHRGGVKNLRARGNSLLKRAKALRDRADGLFTGDGFRKAVTGAVATVAGGLIAVGASILTGGAIPLSATKDVAGIVGKSAKKNAKSTDGLIARLTQDVGSYETDVNNLVVARKGQATQIAQAKKSKQEDAKDRALRDAKNRREDDKAGRKLKVPDLYTYVTARDERVRHNHAPFDGLVLARDAYIARNILPPNGWNCRCAIVKVDDGRKARLYAEQTERLGSLKEAIDYFFTRKLPAGASRDSGFK